MSFNSKIPPPTPEKNFSMDTEQILKRRMEAREAISSLQTESKKTKVSVRSTTPSKPVAKSPNRPILANEKPTRPQPLTRKPTTIKPTPMAENIGRPQPLARKLPNVKSTILSSRTKNLIRTTTPTKPNNSSTTRPAPLKSRSSNRNNTSNSSFRSTTSTNGSKATPNTSFDNGALGSEIQTPPKSKKRAAWDVKGRLEDMEKNNNYLNYQVKSSKVNLSSVNEKLAESQSQIVELEHFRKSLENKVQVKSLENNGLQSQVMDLENTLERLKIQSEEKIRSLTVNHELELHSNKSKLDMVNREKDLLFSELDNVTVQLKSKIDENASLTNTISTQAASYLGLESDNRALKNRLEATNFELDNKTLKISSLEDVIAELKTSISMLEDKVRNEEGIRRQLHNTIQELKGNIRVFCRVRPPIGTETSFPGALGHLTFPIKDNESKTIEVKQTKDSSVSKPITKTFPFSFDKVFTPQSTQSQVFEEISQLVQSALDGYPICIFAYGQTGSGKTFTMEGPEKHDDESEGMIPRAVSQIFATAEKLKEKGWSYTMKCQFIEIYNEAIHDLLGGGENKKHDIRHDNNGKTTVTDINIVSVKDPKAVHNLLQHASKNRAVAATNCNERSSRSHSVFTMRLIGKNSLTQESSDGVLNLIDLAGSESLTKSGSTGDRLKETQAINKSLSCLSDVIYALSSGNSHIPYRNSKLTYLLQNSLGGNSKTLMFVNVSPLLEHVQETLYSLQFATKVNSCQIGTAKRMKKDPM